MGEFVAIFVLLGIVLSIAMAALTVITVLAVRNARTPDHQYVTEMVRLITIAWERGAQHKAQELSREVGMSQDRLSWPEPEPDPRQPSGYSGSHQSNYEAPFAEDEASIHSGESR